MLAGVGELVPGRVDEDLVEQLPVHLVRLGEVGGGGGDTHFNRERLQGMCSVQACVHPRP